MRQHTNLTFRKNVLVTGGAGFIGSNYVYYHFDKYPSDQIFVLDKLTYAGNLNNIKGLLNEDRVKFIEGDIADEKFIFDLFEAEKFDTVINFAAETHVDRSIKDPKPFVHTNVNGTFNLLEASRKYHVKRYHQISTDEVYGDLGFGSTDYFTEQTPITPNCPYAATKAAADIMVLSYEETYGMPITISRCSNNYGPYQFPEKLIPFFFNLASQDKQLPVYGDGLNVRDWLYVVDHCRAIDMIVQSDKYGEVYNIGGHNEYNNLEITKFILDFFGKDESMITYVEDRKAHDRRYAMDPSKIGRELGWKPSVTFQQGIAKTFDWYTENDEWVKEIVGRLEIPEFKIQSKTPLEATR